MRTVENGMTNYSRRLVVGDVVGRLTVVAITTPRGGRVLCRCQCGNVTNVAKFRLLTGHTQSCGCLERENAAARLRTHGDSHKPLWYVWKAMLCRCLNPRCAAYINYGARGITVCAAWRQFPPFEAWALNNGYRQGLQLDRRDNDGAYSPDNCRWVTQQENLRNKRSRARVMADRQQIGAPLAP